MAHIAMLVPGWGSGGTERFVQVITEGMLRRDHSIDILFTEPVEDEWSMKFPESAGVHFLSGLHMDKEQCIRLGIPEAAKVYRHNSDRVENFLQTAGIRLRKLRRPSFGSKQIRRALGILPYFETVKPDIVFTNYMQYVYPLHYLAKTSSNFPPVVSVFHIAVTEREARRRTAPIPDSFEAVAVSEGALQSFEAAGIVRPGQGRVIYNPACTPDIDELAKIEPGHSWLSDGGPPVILSAGRLEPQKDFPTLIDAFRRVRATRPCRLVILGEGPLRPELEARIASLGLNDCVSLPGWVENPFAFMARAALFVLSSAYEGFGIVLVEALACGCPAVSTDCRAGPSEILEDPALLAPVGDPDALAQAMTRALDRPADKAALRAGAARFSVERALDGYEALIADVLAERSRPKKPECGR